MTATVMQWGNSLGLRIPAALARELKLTRGASIELRVENGSLIARPSKQHKYELKDLVAAMDQKNRHELESWGGPVGNEVW